ncbi:MAG: class I SAM-dependent methyltransferase [Methanothrix sp.]
MDKIKSPSNGEKILDDLLKGRYQKERKIDKSEINSKTLVMLKEVIINAVNSKSKVLWLDIGCGDGRCLEILEVFNGKNPKKTLAKIRYLGLDSSSEFKSRTEELIKKYNIIGECKKAEASKLRLKDKYDVISMILVLHEMDPLEIPIIFKNAIKMLKEDGRLIISDFNDPYEPEKNILIWKEKEILNIINYTGGLIAKSELSNAERVPNVKFYNIDVRKFNVAKGQFKCLMNDYDKILKLKSLDLITEYRQIEDHLINKIYTIMEKKVTIKNLSHDDRSFILSKFTDDDFALYDRKELIKEQHMLIDEKRFELEKIISKH